MKIKSAVWQGAHTVRKKLCQLVLFVQENAWQTGVQGKKASVAWMREFIWQKQQRSPHPEKNTAPEPFVPEMQGSSHM